MPALLASLPGNHTATTLVAVPRPGGSILSFDVACQSSDTTVVLPSVNFAGTSGIGPYLIVSGASQQAVLDFDLSGVLPHQVPWITRLEATLLSGACTHVGWHGRVPVSVPCF